MAAAVNGNDLPAHFIGAPLDHVFECLGADVEVLVALVCFSRAGRAFLDVLLSLRWPIFLPGIASFFIEALDLFFGKIAAHFIIKLQIEFI